MRSAATPASSAPAAGVAQCRLPQCGQLHPPPAFAEFGFTYSVAPHPPQRTLTLFTNPVAFVPALYPTVSSSARVNSTPPPPWRRAHLMFPEAMCLVSRSYCWSSGSRRARRGAVCLTSRSSCSRRPCGGGDREQAADSDPRLGQPRTQWTHQGAAGRTDRSPPDTCRPYS
jgi:hypothetical protein